MASKIKVDNITDQDDNAVISRCGATHTVTAEVYKADTIKDTSDNTYLAKCGTAVTVGGSGQTVSAPGNDVRSNNFKASDGGNLISQSGTANTIGASGDSVAIAGNDIRSNNYKAEDGGIIISQSGTTITLGACGDTVQLASGVTNGLGGGIDWQTTPKTADFNAAAGEGYFVDTSSNEVTVTLPAGVAGESVTVLDYIANANTNEIFLKPQSGEKIEGATSGQVVATIRQATTLVYSGSTQGWLVSSSGDSGPIQTPTITFSTASGSLGTLNENNRTDPNGNLSPITATASFGTLTYSIQSGSLPAGLTINSSTGAFVGSADAQSSDTTSNFTVRATITETGTFSDRDFSILYQGALFVTATGGTVNTSGNFKIHTFNGPGTFTVSCAGNATGSNTVDYMVVAGGGAAHTSGPGGKGGGGGAGGFRTSSGAASGCYSTSPLGSGVSALPVSAQGYPITVGGGGSGSPNRSGTSNSGSSSTFSNITSAGGGAAGGNESSGNGTNGTSGGSGGGGGGGGSFNGSGGSGNTPPVSPPQGNSGGGSSGGPQRGGGGGGAGGGGGTNTAGSGTSSSITTSPVTYSEGGTGYPGPAGAGPSNSGDGGSGTRGENTPAASGGSGIVVIRYKFQ